MNIIALHFPFYFQRAKIFTKPLNSFGFFILNAKIYFNARQGIAAEKKEAKAEKEEADKYQKLIKEVVSSGPFFVRIYVARNI